MGYVTREMIDRAKKMDLLTYLQTYEPQELVHFGGNTYCTREHDSLKISNGKWCWFSRGIGGKTALDYLIKVKELPFTEAVERIVGRAAERPSVFHARAQPEKPKTLLLPPKSNSNTRVIAYLKSRGIDGGLIEQCIRSGQLYESLPYHNAVFVGMDRNGTPRYACLRGIGTDFKGEATGSDKRFSFALPATGESRMLCVFESAIDLLSYATMAQAGGLSWRSQHLLSFVDGIKYHRTEKDYHDMRTVSDTLCREYNLSVIQRPQAGKSKHYGEWRAEQEQRPTWRGLIRSGIDELIRQSVTEKQFYYLLRQKGYEVKFGKDISVRPPGKERFVRLTRNFGEAYTAEAIRQRILQQPLPQPERQMTDKPRPKTYRVQGSRQAARKITGFRALYFYYCYKLGIFPKGRPQNRARLHFLLREDLLKLNNISQEVRLLARHQIDTAEQLALYKKEQEVNIRELSAKRRVLQNALRTKAVRDSPKQADAHRAQIRELSERLKALRREVHLCDDIAERSGVMAEKLKAVREDAQKQRQKEEQQHEHIWRRS